jgi:CRISPR/Cas system-associated exonuclease Cas4 (RecB family)
MIIERIYEQKAKKIKNYPCHVNRASSLGDPCLRKLVYERTNWQDKTLYDVGLQMIFDEGNNQESIVVRDLMDAGFEIFEQQRAFEIKDLQITGHMDLKIKVPGDDATLYPCEIKSMAPHIFDKIKELKDFQNPSYPWLQKYPAQLLLYMLASNEDKGVFILKNKSTGALKEIWLDLDWDLADELYAKAAEINRHIEAGTLPDRTSELELCERCYFRHICTPDKDFGEGVLFEQDESLTAMLDRLEETKEIKSEYERLNKTVSKILKEKDNIVVGDKYLVRGKFIDRKAYTVEAGRYWKKSILKIA